MKPVGKLLRFNEAKSRMGAIVFSAKPNNADVVTRAKKPRSRNALNAM